MTNTVKHAKLGNPGQPGKAEAREAGALAIHHPRSGTPRLPTLARTSRPAVGIWRHRLGSATKGGKHFYSRYQTITLGLADDTSSGGRRARVVLRASDGRRAGSDRRPAWQGARAHSAAGHGPIRGVQTLARSRCCRSALPRPRSYPPVLGDFAVEDLTAEQLRRWLAQLAAMPAQKRPKAGAPSSGRSED